MEIFDYGIIGGGPAGYSAGMFLAKQGKSVVLFEKDCLGGTCLNRGCIPTKSLLHSSQLFEETKKLEEFGIKVSAEEFDFSKIIEKKDKTVEKIRKSLELAVKNSGVRIIYNEACIKNNTTILAGDNEYNVDKIILATGSRPRQIKGLEFDNEFILNSDDILNLKKLPKSILIVGSGAIGIEWARIFSNFGVEVAIVELAENLIPLADIDISKRIERIFKQKKIKFFLKTSIEKIENRLVTLSSGEIISPDFVLVAAGREANTQNMECECVLGDACNQIQLAHFAISQAKALALGLPFDKDLVPSIIYGEPEIAWVGIQEKDCDEDCKSTLLPITALGKSWCDDSTDGFIKVITKDDKICGASIMSKEASSLIHIFLIAIKEKLSIEELKSICFAHPTYAEGIFDILMNI